MCYNGFIWEVVVIEPEQVENINRLLDTYGSLLKPRNLELMRLYFAEDLSMGEIGQVYSITRQAVQDQVSRTVQALVDYEAKLGIIKRQHASEQLQELWQQYYTGLPLEARSTPLIAALHQHMVS